MSSNICNNCEKFGVYVRASKDDPESDTIENQKTLIRNYVKTRPDIQISEVYEDNGYSGATFIRPSFSRMMEDITQGRINGIILKDISRLSRNYLDALNFIRNVCPANKVRFVAINDNYDSSMPETLVEALILPFKSLLNEHVLADTSKKIRSSLQALRARGDFVAAFAPYGYKRDPENKHRMIPDEPAAIVVRDIFSRKIQGYSNRYIADELNSSGEASPLEYKKKNGIFLSDKFQTNPKPLWAPLTIIRILSNPVYIGTLAQGITTTPNFKVKTRIKVPVAERAVISDAHDPIIEKNTFDLVQQILASDTRSVPNKLKVFPYAGIIYCADCKGAMVRKMVGSYPYYVCAAHKNDKNVCSTHNTSVRELDNAVVSVINSHLWLIRDIENCLSAAWIHPARKKRMERCNSAIEQRHEEISRKEGYRHGLHEDCTDGIITKVEFQQLWDTYTTEIELLKGAIEMFKKELELINDGDDDFNKAVRQFRTYKGIAEPSRALVVSLIKRIEVNEGKKISVQMQYQDYFQCAMDGVERRDFQHGAKEQKESAV